MAFLQDDGVKKLFINYDIANQDNFFEAKIDCLFQYFCGMQLDTQRFSEANFYLMINFIKSTVDEGAVAIFFPMINIMNTERGKYINSSLLKMFLTDQAFRNDFVSLFTAFSSWGIDPTVERIRLIPQKLCPYLTGENFNTSFNVFVMPLLLAEVNASADALQNVSTFLQNVDETILQNINNNIKSESQARLFVSLIACDKIRFHDYHSWWFSKKLANYIGFLNKIQLLSDDYCAFYCDTEGALNKINEPGDFFCNDLSNAINKNPNSYKSSDENELDDLDVPEEKTNGFILMSNLFVDSEKNKSTDFLPIMDEVDSDQLNFSSETLCESNENLDNDEKERLKNLNAMKVFFLYQEIQAKDNNLEIFKTLLKNSNNSSDINEDNVSNKKLKFYEEDENEDEYELDDFDNEDGAGIYNLSSG